MDIHIVIQQTDTFGQADAIALVRPVGDALLAKYGDGIKLIAYKDEFKHATPMRDELHIVVDVRDGTSYEDVLTTCKQLFVEMRERAAGRCLMTMFSDKEILGDKWGEK